MTLLEFSSTVRTRLFDSELGVVLTGGGGWLGQATLEMLDSSFGSQMTSRTHVFASRRRSITLRSGTHLEVYPLHELDHLKIGPHVLVHYAFATRELVSELGVAQYIARNEEITQRVVEHVRSARPFGMLAPSSGAVYLGDDLETNPYGVLKARDERKFIEIANEVAGTRSAPRLVIPRVFNVAGPFLNKPDHYVLGSIIRDIFRGGPIQLRANGPVVRSYVHVGDLVDLGFAMMIGDTPTLLEAFDTAGERTIEVGELAKLTASVLGAPGMEIVRPPLDDTPADRYVGDSGAINALAESYGIRMKALPRQIEDTATYLRS